MVSLRLILVCSKAFGPLLGGFIVKGPEYSSENKKYILIWKKTNSKTRKHRKNSELQVRTELKTLSSDALTSELLEAL